VKEDSKAGKKGENKDKKSKGLDNFKKMTDNQEKDEK